MWSCYHVGYPSGDKYVLIVHLKCELESRKVMNMVTLYCGTGQGHWVRKIWWWKFWHCCQALLYTFLELGTNEPYVHDQCLVMDACGFSASWDATFWSSATWIEERDKARALSTLPRTVAKQWILYPRRRTTHSLTITVVFLYLWVNKWNQVSVCRIQLDPSFPECLPPGIHTDCPGEWQSCQTLRLTFHPFWPFHFIHSCEDGFPIIIL